VTSGHKKGCQGLQVLERRLSLIFDRRFAFLPGSENAKTTRKNNGVHHRSPTKPDNLAVSRLTLTLIDLF
jgi:hypothetical protein